MNNKYYLTLPTVDQGLQIPIEIKWDFEGRTDSIEIYEEQVLEEVIGLPTDFEIFRFSHKEYGTNQETNIKYDFFFFNNSGATPITTASITDWENSYVKEGFTTKEIYEYSNQFTKSFFKIDFYDSPDAKTQTNYFTVIIPTQQGAVTNASISPFAPLNNVKIKKPSFKLDFVGDKEGFFIYWLRNPKFLDIKTFYMSAKFFDAKIGVFVRMMNEPQSNFVGDNKFSFDEKIYFFNKVVLNFDTKTYEIFNSLNQRIGTTTPMKWYEYVNKPTI